MRCAGAVGGPGRAEFSPATMAGRAGSGAVRPGAGAGVSTERSREHHDRSPSGVARALSALNLLLGAAARLLKRDHGAIQDRPAEDTPADAAGSIPRRDGFAASLFVFAALGTGPAGAARIEVWTATLTPTEVSGDLGCLACNSKGLDRPSEGGRRLRVETYATNSRGENR